GFPPHRRRDRILQSRARGLPAPLAVLLVDELEPFARRALHRRRPRILRKCHVGRQHCAGEERERCPAHWIDLVHPFTNASTAVRVTRHCVPIFLPLRSPASRLAITSDSSTASTLATCAGVRSSAAPAAGGAGVAMPGVPCAMSPPVWFIICCAMAMP